MIEKLWSKDGLKEFMGRFVDRYEDGSPHPVVDSIDDERKVWEDYLQKIILTHNRDVYNNVFKILWKDLCT